MDNRLRKKERLCSRYLIDRLFTPGNSRSLSAYPLRLVYHIEKTEEGEANNGVSLLISVPKRCFKHAVDRNHVKRLVREAYRTNKQLLNLPEDTEAQIAVIWLDNKHYPTEIVTEKIKNLLQRLNESCAKS